MQPVDRLSTAVGNSVAKLRAALQIKSSDGIDLASYRNRGGVYQKVVSWYKLSKYFDEFGHDNVIKASAVFRITPGASLKVGSGSTIQDYVFFQLTKPDPKVFIGSNTVIGRGSIITAKNLIDIGDDVLIGSYVQIIDHGHAFSKDKLIREQKAIIGEVKIGSDTWIGAGAKILMNSSIGPGAVIGANSVVTKDIPSYAIAVGAPARIIGYRQ